MSWIQFHKRVLSSQQDNLLFSLYLQYKYILLFQTNRIPAMSGTWQLLSDRTYITAVILQPVAGLLGCWGLRSEWGCPSRCGTQRDCLVALDPWKCLYWEQKDMSACSWSGLVVTRELTLRKAPVGKPNKLENAWSERSWPFSFAALKWDASWKQFWRHQLERCALLGSHLSPWSWMMAAYYSSSLPGVAYFLMPWAHGGEF